MTTKQTTHQTKNLAFFVIFLSLISISSKAYAAAATTIAPSPCDPHYYTSLENRAWLEAQREITQNQNLIFKPDSVLSYTCFDKQLDVLGARASNMFSESSRWGNSILPARADHMNKALEGLVLTSLKVYLDANFHGSVQGLLGGRSSTDRPTIGSDVPDGSYSCNIMQTVWQEAKCYDFQKETHDGFFPLKDYADGLHDWRPYPDPSNACGEPTGTYASSMTAAGIDFTANGSADAPWQFDPTQPYLAQFDAAQCGSQTPILTGIQVTPTDGSSYPERVCLQPGCHYRPTGGSAGNCVP